MYNHYHNLSLEPFHHRKLNNNSAELILNVLFLCVWKIGILRARLPELNMVEIAKSQTSYRASAFLILRYLCICFQKTKCVGEGPLQSHWWPSTFLCLPSPLISLPGDFIFLQIRCLVNTNSICNVLTPFRCQECARCYLGKITCPLDLLYKLSQTLTWKEEVSIHGKFIILNMLFKKHSLKTKCGFHLCMITKSRI